MANTRNKLESDLLIALNEKNPSTRLDKVRQTIKAIDKEIQDNAKRAHDYPKMKFDQTPFNLNDALQKAANLLDKDCVNLLQEAKADIHGCKSIHYPQYNPLTQAVLDGNIHYLKFLLEIKADVNNYTIEKHVHYGYILDSTFFSKYTPLATAIEKGHIDCLKLLLSAKANINIKSGNVSFKRSTPNETALALAIRLGNSECIDILLKAEKEQQQALSHRHFSNLFRRLGAHQSTPVEAEKFRLKLK